MRLIEVFEGPVFKAQMVINLLENEGIECSLKDEIIGNRGGGALAPTGGVSVIVADSDYENARLIVAEYENSLTSNQPESNK